MAGADGLTVAVVGLQFGAEFVPIYRDHPAVTEVIACDADVDLLANVAERFDVRAVPRLGDVLASAQVDAVHLVTGFRDHADHTTRALHAGKHVACTVPMAMSFAEIDTVLAAQRDTGLTYMMMETAVYTREFLFAQQMMDEDRFGTIAYARGEHFQDMTGWPPYWAGLPPMYYATHAVAPVLALLDTQATHVTAYGSGRLASAARSGWANRFPVETATFRLDGTDAMFDVTRSLAQLARSYTESFAVYGDRGSFEWAQLESSEDPVWFTMHPDTGSRGRPIEAQRVAVPDRAELLPPQIARYTNRFTHEGDRHRSFVQGGGHGGSHPHLVHEFVSSVVEGRAPAIDHDRAAAWSAAGIAAHESAGKGGELVAVPGYRRRSGEGGHEPMRTGDQHRREP